MVHEGDRVVDRVVVHEAEEARASFLRKGTAGGLRVQEVHVFHVCLDPQMDPREERSAYERESERSQFRYCKNSPMVAHHLRKLEFPLDIEACITSNRSVVFRLAGTFCIIVRLDKAFDERPGWGLDFAINDYNLVSFVGDDDGADLDARFEFTL